MIEITVYADVLFLINFSMDLITLYLTARVLHKPIKRGRLCTSAVIGGVSGTAAVLLFDTDEALYNVIFVLCGFIISAAMTAFAFGKAERIGCLLRDSIVLWGTGALLGGVMTYILSLGEPVFIKKSRTASFAAAFALCFAVSYVITRIFSVSRHKKTAEIAFSAAEIEVRLTALCDSGNLAADPLSSLPVIFVSAKNCGRLAKLLAEPDDRLRIRAIPIKTVAGEKLCFGFIPDKLTVDGDERDAVIVAGEENASYGGYGGLVPSSLCDTHKTKRRVKESWTEKRSC